MTSDDIIAVARECLGTPFRHQGRLVGVGLDCAGVAVHVMRRLGIPYEDMRGYPRIPYDGMIAEVLDRQSHMMRVLDMQLGDVLLMRFAAEPQHVAICAGDTIIHAFESSGRVVEHRFSSMWRARVVHIYRIMGVA